MGDKEDKTPQPAPDAFGIGDDDGYDGAGFEGLEGWDDIPDEPATSAGDNDPGNKDGGTGDAPAGSDKPQDDKAADGGTLDDRADTGAQTDDEPPPGDAEEPPEDEGFETLKALQMRNEQLSQAIVSLHNQLQQITGMVQAGQQPPATPPKEDPEDDIEQLMKLPGMPSEKEWAENPTAAMMRGLQIIRQRDQERIKSLVRTEAKQLTQQELQQMRVEQEQRQAWEAAVRDCPEIAIQGTPVNQTYQQIMADESLNLSRSPLGPYIAASTAMRIHGIAPANVQQQAQQQGQRLGAAAERGRQQRLKAGVMQSGGKGGKPSITLTAEQRAVAKRMGLKPEAYAEALQANME